MMKTVTLTPPPARLVGRVVLPGSKSITNRALLMAGLAKGTSRLTGVLKSDDTRWMAEALHENRAGGPQSRPGEGKQTPPPATARGG